MRRKAAMLQAQRLIGEFGPAAYEQALAAERVARRKHDKRLANFLAEVVRQIAGPALTKQAASCAAEDQLEHLRADHD
jgi:hypothetical protein